MAAVVEAIRSGDRFLVTSHENPDGDAARVVARDAPRAPAAREGQRDGTRRPGAAARPSTDSSTWRSHGLRRDLPADAAERVLLAVDCAQETRLTDVRLLDSRVVVNVDHHHDNTRFGTVNLVVADASSTAEMLADVFGELGVSLTPGDRRGALRRPRDRYRPLPVREHDTQGVAPGRRAPRGRRRHPADLPGRVRVDAVREGEAPCPRARPGHACTRRAGSWCRTSSGVTSARSERRSRTPRGSSTSCGRWRARSSPRSSASRLGTSAPARKVSLRSSDDRVDVSAIARAREAGAIGRRPGSRASSRSPRSPTYIVSAFAAIPAVHA